jgi:hypothetical protein
MHELITQILQCTNAFGRFCSNIDDSSHLSYTESQQGNWTSTQSANGVGATATITGWNGTGGLHVWLTPTIN